MWKSSALNYGASVSVLTSVLIGFSFLSEDIDKKPNLTLAVSWTPWRNLCVSLGCFLTAVLVWKTVCIVLCVYVSNTWCPHVYIYVTVHLQLLS